MTKEKALAGVVSVLCQVSGAKPASIKKTHKLKDYVPVVGAMGFALAIDNQFPALDLTDLVNSLYDPIATVGDLVDYVVDNVSDEG